MIDKLLSIAFSGLFGFLGVCILLNGLMYFIINGFIRLARMIVVLVHGWPPSHLDADGDWKRGENKSE